MAGSRWLGHGPLAKCVKLRVAHAPGIPGMFSLPPRVSDPDLHHGTCVAHVPWCMPGSLTSRSLWSQLRGKRSLHSRRMRNPQFDISSKRPIDQNIKAKHHQTKMNLKMLPQRCGHISSATTCYYGEDYLYAHEKHRCHIKGSLMEMGEVFLHAVWFVLPIYLQRKWVCVIPTLIFLWAFHFVVDLRALSMFVTVVTLELGNTCS